MTSDGKKTFTRRLNEKFVAIGNECAIESLRRSLFDPRGDLPDRHEPPADIFEQLLSFGTPHLRTTGERGRERFLYFRPEFLGLFLLRAACEDIRKGDHGIDIDSARDTFVPRKGRELFVRATQILPIDDLVIRISLSADRDRYVYVTPFEFAFSYFLDILLVSPE